MFKEHYIWMCSISGCIQLHVEFTIFLLLTVWRLLFSIFPADTWIHWISDPLMSLYVQHSLHRLFWFCSCSLLGLYCCTLHTLYSSKTASPFKSVHCFTILCFCICWFFCLEVSLFPFILNDYPLISVCSSNDRLLETLSFFLRYKWSLFPLFHHCTISILLN